MTCKAEGCFHLSSVSVGVTADVTSDALTCGFVFDFPQFSSFISLSADPNQDRNTIYKRGNETLSCYLLHPKPFCCLISGCGGKHMTVEERVHMLMWTPWSTASCSTSWHDPHIPDLHLNMPGWIRCQRSHATKALVTIVRDYLSMKIWLYGCPGILAIYSAKMQVNISD